LLLFDLVRGKITTRRALSKWRQSAFLRRQRRQLFQSSLTAPDFDLASRIDRIAATKRTITKIVVASEWRRQIVQSQAAGLVNVLLRKRSLRRYISLWESKFRDRLVHLIHKFHKKVESTTTGRLPDLLGTLHGLISRQAELETELENREREISDLMAVIAAHSEQRVELESLIRSETQEHDRVHALRNGIDCDYKDQIANLRMALSAIGTRRTRIDEGRQRLSLQKRAKKITSETLGESQESLQERLTKLRQKLEAAQTVAVQFRDELLATEQEQNEGIGEIVRMKGEIARLKQECEGLADRAEDGQAVLGDSLEALNEQYQEVEEELEKAQKVIEQYNEELVDQDGKIDILSRELALSRQRYKTAVHAFRDDEEI
jgi:chromosome segregation ATPase